MPSKPQRTRSRGWCFTLNNYTDDEFNNLQKVDCQYIIYGQETATTTATKHLQGYVHYKNAVSPGHVKATIGTRAHIEVRRGSIQEAVDYCKKEGSWFQRGTLRIPDENRWTDIIKLAEQGKMDVIKEEYPAQYLRYKANLESLQCPDVKPLDSIEGAFEWWYGKTGTGKSRKLQADYPDAYDKAINKWWDGYKYEDVVFIEEADPKKCEHMGHFFKRWADHNPFGCEIKNGHLTKVRPKKIIVTSNYTIKECFPNQCDWEPLERRFKQVHFASLSPHATTYTPSVPLPAIDENYNIPGEPMDTTFPFEFDLDEPNFNSLLESL